MARIHASAQHLDGLIRDVLDLASSQVGQLRLVREPLDLRQALEVVVLIGQQMASDKGLTWVAEIPDHLPRVWGDRTRLRQVALNLVSNAFRFTSEGEVRFRIELVGAQDQATGEDVGRAHAPRTAFAPQTAFVRVSVSDTGIGVPVEEQEIIFDEFRQSERTAARGYGGLGLGLAISRRLVEMHGGSVSVESSGIEGEGTTFSFTVPVLGVEGGTPVESLHPEAGALAQSGPVVILSDRMAEARELSSYLEERGYAVQVIRIEHGESLDDPQSWLRQVLEHTPSAVILGMKPATEQGWAMMRVLKDNPETSQTPVLFYSLLQDTDSGSMLALDYLTKPASAAGLVEMLARQGVLASQGTGMPTAATILVVDDEPEMLATHTWLLQSHCADCRILQAGNGREALEVMAQARPDLVLLDLMMPEMSGFEVISHMQVHPDLCNIPIVVLTGKTLTADALAQLNQGVTAVLGKGLFSAEETLTHLEAALRRSALPSLETRTLVRRAMAYIHEHYTESISRKEIAAYVNLSPRHLDRCFSDETAVTPMVYLSRFRLRQARRLLQTTALSISEVAAAVGFSDSSYFCRVFRRDLGMSPTDYRRSHS
jgi:AraC-like DNA-binding protein